MVLVPPTQCFEVTPPATVFNNPNYPYPCAQCSPPPGYAYPMPDPDFPTASPPFDNVTRRWMPNGQPMSSTNPVVWEVNMPTVDSFGLPITQDIFYGAPGGISYLYAQFQAAIAQTMANFTAVPTAGIHAVQATMPYTVNGQAGLAPVSWTPGKERKMLQKGPRWARSEGDTVPSSSWRQ